MKTLAAFLFAALAFAQPRPKVIVLVIDGLRPDLIRPEIMPTLARLRQEGTWCDNAHSVFPTVTRVNSATISTGTFPAFHGIVSNTMWVDAVSPRPFDTANYENLLKLAQANGGRTLAVPTLAETLESHGIHFAALSSGSTGSGFLLNPEKAGVLISSGFEGGKRAAYPDKANREILDTFGTEKADAGIPSLLWTEKVLRSYVLEKLHPDVVIDWMTEPDESHHRDGVGSPAALAALKATDEQIALLLKTVGRGTNLIVTADHGFAAEPDPVDVTFSSDFIVASNGASAFLYAKNKDAIRPAVEQLQQSPDVDAIFTRSSREHCVEGKQMGWIPGTFALELIGECNEQRGADIVIDFVWTSDKNEHGYPGTQKIISGNKAKGIRGRSGHGGLNAWMVHTPMLFWGPDFRKTTRIEAPVANVDIAPTILALEGIKAPASMRGRVIAESFAKSKTKEPHHQTQSIRAESAGFCSELQLSIAAKHTYIDQAHRCSGQRSLDKPSPQ